MKNENKAILVLTSKFQITDEGKYTKHIHACQYALSTNGNAFVYVRT